MMYRRLATASALVPLAFALLGLAAWATGRLRLASLDTAFIPMAPATAVGFVLVSAALIAVAFGRGTAMRRAVRAAASLVLLFAFLGLLAFFGNTSVVGWEAALVGQSGTFGAVPLARMSPLTATTFALVGLALACLTSHRSPAVRDLAGVLGILALLMGSTVALGYAYGAPLLYGGPVIPMALTTGLAFMGTGVALIALAGATSLPLRPFFRGAIRAERAEAERRRAEKALRDSETLNRSLVEHLPQRIFVKDRNSRYVFCNSKFALDLGIEQAQIVGRDDFAFFPPELAEAFRADDRTVMAEGTVKVHDERYELAGEERWIHTTKIPYRDERGEIIGVLGIFENVTERKQAEAELSQERDRAQRYLDTAEVILLALDRQERITLVNRYACSILGWTADELLGRDWVDTCLPARMRDALREKLHNLFGGDLSIVESPVLTKSGDQRLIEWRNTLVRDEEGHVVGTFSSGVDITERRRAEEEIRRHAERSAQAEREFRALFAGNPLPMWIYDLTTLQVLEVNDAAVRRYGYERDEFLAMTIKDIRPREDVERLLTHLDRPRDTWQASGSWRHRFKSGRIIDVDVTSHTITFAGQSARLVVAQDITERKQSEDALRSAEERTRFALESADVGIWDMDYATGVLRWSETIEAHYGLQPGTFGGTFEAFVERVHPDDRASVLETMGNAMKSGSDFSVQHRTIWPDGTVRSLSSAGRIFLGEHGEPVRGVGISLDVTERRALEAQFQQAQKMEAVGRLAGGVAHDFNNLLTVILGFCELLLVDRDPDDSGHADIAEIQQAATRAAALTRQLLAFSRKQIVEPTLLDLNVVMADLRGMLGRLIGEDVKVVLGLGPELGLVRADRGQVEQIVMNLAVNARDAMPNGGTLTIGTANVELDEHYAKTHLAVKPGPFVALTVTDTGTGMTPQVQSRLFEPFFTTKEPGKGTGLGLATVYGIVTQSGGSVGVYSEVGRGTSFRVYFPRADTAELVVASPAPAAPPPAATQTVLVVEDQHGVRELARRLLERLGYTVLTAADADAALRLFEGNPSIDVLLTDIVMPGASGPELTRQLVEQRPALKVIYMSGYTEDAIVQHGILTPGIAFLNKPFTSETLGRKLREVLDR